MGLLRSPKAEIKESDGLRSLLDTGGRSASQHIPKGIIQFLAVEDGDLFLARGLLRATRLPEAACIPCHVAPPIFMLATVSCESVLSSNLGLELLDPHSRGLCD